MQKTIMHSEKEWLDLRLKVVTATEGASISGLNRWSSAMQMWKNKIENSFTGNAYTRIGQLLEPAVVEVTNEILNTNFALYEDIYKGKVFFNDTEVGVGATPDAVDGEVLLECKTTKPFSFLRYRECPPEQYVMQVLIQMYCTGIREGYLSILSTDLTQHTPELNWPIAIYKIERSDKLISLYLIELRRFWQCIKDGKMFRVNSTYKKQAKLLAKLCYRKII